MDKNLPETGGKQGEVLDPVPRPGSLANLRKVRQELGRAYRDARQGKMETAELSRLAYALNILGKLCEGESFEARMDRIEETLERER